MTHVYVLRSPADELIAETVAYARDEAWVNAFNFLCALDQEFANRYWGKWAESKRAARRRGWRIVPVELVMKERP